jgi:hypothetical protein
MIRSFWAGGCFREKRPAATGTPPTVRGYVEKKAHTKMVGWQKRYGRDKRGDTSSSFQVIIIIIIVVIIIIIIINSILLL